MRPCTLIGGLLALLLAPGTLHAEPANQSAAADGAIASAASAEAQPVSSEEQSPASKKKWEFATIGYAWFAGAKGQTDVNKALPPAEIDLSFGDVLKAFKFAFMGAAEARHDRLIILGDLTFIHLDARKGIGVRDPDFLKVELDSRTAEITLVGGYRVVNHGPVAVDLLAGGRANCFKTTLQLEGPNRQANGEVKKSWVDPLIAARASAGLGGKWSAALYGDVGGFGIGSQVTWQAIPTVNYSINHKMTLGAGWRIFKVNYRSGDFLYNVRQSGPLITFRTAL